MLNITQTAAGTENHSVQIVQANLPIEKGSSYKLSYEAYADAERTMITNITAPDLEYIRYLADTKVTLTTTSQKFEHTFEMTSNSDDNGRVEFNLGNQGSTAAVHIDNVRLEKLGSLEEGEDNRSVLPDGNYVYNGSFDEGNEPGRLRLAYWDWKVSKGARVSVTNDSGHELKVAVPETVSSLGDVVVYQKPITINGGRKYKLSFDAYADQAKTIKTSIAGETFESALTTEKKEYTYEFDAAEGLGGSELRFLLGAPCTTYIDNVSIRKVGADTGLIVNGDFTSGLTGFEPYVHSNAAASYTVDGLTENDAFSIDIENTGGPNAQGAIEDWYIQLKQNNIQLEKDKWYKLDFKAKSTLDRQIKCALQRDGNKHNDDWTPYFEKSVIDLTGEYQNYSYTFMMKEDTDPEAVFSITMGSVGGKQITTKHTIVIDDITLVETEAQEIPPVVEGKEMIANGDFSEGDAHWENAVTAPGAAEVSFADGKAAYKITNVGTEDWHIQLKHKDALTLEQGAEYAVNFTVKSTAARTVKYAFLDPTNDYDWYGGEDLSLTANAEKKVEYTLKVSKATCDTINFVISMGKIAGEDTPISTIEIDDISVKKLDGTGGEEPVEPVDPVDPGSNLIKNGNFLEGEDGSMYWAFDKTEGTTVTFTKGESEEKPGKVTFDISDVGSNDWDIKFRNTENLTLEQGASYKVKFKIKSTAARIVKYSFMTPDYAWYGGEDLNLAANVEQSVDYEMNVTEASSDKITFSISMGQIKDEKTKEDIPTPASIIEISDISVKKIGGTGGEEPDDPVAIGTDLIKNGNFADGKTNWSDYFHKDGNTAVAEGKSTFTDGKARYEITNAGAEDWNVQLKQEGLKMEKDATYKVNFKIGASIDRDVRLAIMGAGDAWFGGADIHLTKDKLKSYSQIVTLNDNYVSGTVAFQISMGQLGDAKLAAHAIEISDISVTKVEAGTKADAETETEVTITPPGGSGEEPEDPNAENLIKNGDFSEGDANWENYVDESEAKAEATFTDGKATYVISNVGTQDHHIQLKYKELLTLEKGAEYAVKLKIKSTEARIVKYAFLTPAYAWYGGEDLSLTAGDVKEVDYTLKVDKDTSDAITFVISMGQIKDADGNPIETPTSTIEIDDVSVVKVSGSGDLGDTGDEETILGNLIRNGDFAAGDDSWINSSYGDGVATVSFIGGKATYEITNVGTLDSHVQLKQEGLTLEPGATYNVKFNIKSTVARIVRFALLDPENGYDWYGGQDVDLSANVDTKVAYRFTVGEDKNTSETIAFQLSMGLIGDNTPASTIEIDNVSVVKDLIKNGDFAGEKNGWGDYIHTADNGGKAEATSTFADKKARYEITNAGEADWNVQLKQTGLKMEKGATYKVNFKIASTIDRDVKLAFMGSDDATWYAGDDNIALEANKLKSFSRIVTLADKDIDNDGITFQLSMGKIGTISEAHAIEISDISIVQVVAGATADAETETEVTITPPGENKEEPDESDETPSPTTKSADDTDDDSDAVVKEKEDDQDFEDSEDQDDKSDDTVDDEDADSADQDKSDEQTESGDAETSDDQSGSERGDVSEALDDGDNA